jgi:hypothetical protein
MNEPVTSAHAGFRDRSGALVGAGILVVGVGCVLALFAVLTGVVALLGPAVGTPVPPSRMLPGILTYTMLAVAFVWLGIGSMKARRWARTLLLILSWVWLLTGIVGVAMLAVFLPKVFALQPSGDAQLPEGCVGAIVAITLVLMVLFLVLLPGALVLFYRSPHVKATCEARDPVARWTDACPPQVLATSLMLALSAASMLLLVVPYRGVVPVFGRLVAGISGGTISVAVAALLAYCAWAVYRLDPKGWWIVVVTSAVGTVSATITFARVDLVEMYRLMGYSAEELAQIQPFLGVFGRVLFPLIAANALLWLGYLLYLKRHFRRG